MTDQLRQAAQAVIKAWDNDGSTQTMEDLRAALEQQAEPVQEQKYEKRIAPYSTTLSMLLNTAPPQQQAEPVSHAVIAGALFDFMGWLTSRKERLVLSSADEAGPAVEAITAFSKMRGLSLDDAKVQDWQDYTTPPQRPWQGLTDEEMSDIVADIDVDFGDLLWKVICLIKIIEAKLKELNK